MQNIQEQIESYHKSIRAAVTFPITIKVVDEILNLDTKSLIDDYKVEMTQNFDSWYNKHKEKFLTGDKKLGYIFFEHSYPHSENMTAEAYGIASDSPRDEEGNLSLYSIMRDFTASGRITLKALNPLVRFYEEPIEDNNELSSEKEQVRQTYYEINALLLGRAVNEVIYTSPFATICSRPFGIDIQEHDSFYGRYGVAYAFRAESEREEIISFNPSLLQYEIEQLFMQAFTINNRPVIYNIKFALDSYRCSISFDNEESPVSFSIFSIPCNSNFSDNLDNIETREAIYQMIYSVFESFKPKIKEFNLHPGYTFIATIGWDYMNQKTWTI